MSVTPDAMMEGMANLRASSETKAHFDRWALSYDRHFIIDFGYIGPIIIANALTRDQIPRTASIIDAGCGTGLIGEELKKRGFLTLYGADISEKMRHEAEKKSIYRRVFAADFSGETTILDGVYDVAIAADTFGPGQFTTKSLRELIRVVRRGGHIYALVEENVFDTQKFDAVVADLEADKRWAIDRVLTTNAMKNTVRALRLIVARRL